MSTQGDVESVHDRAGQETATGVVLTPVAVEKVQALLGREERNDLRLRVAVQPGGCAGLRYELFFDERLFDADHVTRYGEVSDSPADPVAGRGKNGLSADPGFEEGYDSGYESGKDDDVQDPPPAEGRELLGQGHGEKRPGFEVVIDRRSLPDLRGATIDFVDTLQKAGFVIDNPNAQNGCACGDSFC